ncbi:MAG TPA: RNase adapter RapZ [Actinomycetota bacterium]|nr:RNase adapter RapZ [Actinomycetota bacterium]
MTTDRPGSQVEVTVITGLSGAGRSEAAKALEDFGWFVIDNLPPALISKMMPLVFAKGSDIQRVALVIDARGGQFFAEAAQELENLRREQSNFRMLFLDASDETLVRRFDATRRVHPLAPDDSVAVGIQRERELMRFFRDGADLLIDTSDMSVRKLRSKLAAYFEDETPTEGLKITLISFGFKYGLPLDADIVFDARFLPNPHWIDELRPLSGADDAVQEYVLSHDASQQFIERTRDLLEVLVPGYQAEGRHYLTVAVGCTGGRHRSVVLTERVAALIREHELSVRVIHRDIERDAVPS